MIFILKKKQPGYISVAAQKLIKEGISVNSGRIEGHPKKQPGGKRIGAGRPKGEAKKALGIRVPVKLHKKLSIIVREQVEKLSENNFEK